MEEERATTSRTVRGGGFDPPKPSDIVPHSKMPLGGIDIEHKGALLENYDLIIRIGNKI